MRYAKLFPVLALAAGCRVAESTPAGASPSVPPAWPDSPTSAAVLALLPDGVEKREFVLDCTGCHQMDLARAFPNGHARTRDEWRAIVARMLSFAGWQAGFPIMSAARDADRTAEFLSEHWTVPPAGRPEYGDVASADVREYAFPFAQDLPHDLAVDTDGSIVVTGMFTHRMHVLDPMTGAWGEVAIPVAQANPRALEIDRAGDWWVLLGGPGMVARYRPSTMRWRTWSVGTYGHDVRVDGQGRAWFNAHFSRAPEQIGYVDTSAAAPVILEVPGPAPDAEGGGPIPYGLRIAPDGVVWMTELHGNRVVAFDPAAGDFEFHPMPAPASGPRRLDIDAAGVLWIPAYAAGALVRFDPGTNRFREYPLPDANSLPYIARVDDERGRVWVATGAADALYVFDRRAERFSTVPLPTRGALVRHIDLDPRDGSVWAAYGASPGIPPKIAHIRLR